MESTIAASTQPQVTVGVDTHKQFHVAHAVDELGRPLGTHRLAAEVVPVFVEFEVAVPHLRPAGW